MEISIIIVNYKSKDKLIECLHTIKENFSSVSYEVIVVDNENDKSLKEHLAKEKNTTYILSKENLGFGGGNNLGASRALSLIHI